MLRTQPGRSPPINGTGPIHVSKRPSPRRGCAITNSGPASRESTTFTAIAICSARVLQSRNSRPDSGTSQNASAVWKAAAYPPVTPSVGCEMEFARTRDILQQRRRMKMPKRLIDCLDENKASYEILRHPEAVTAQRIAQAEHVKGRRHAKVVMVKSGEEHLMIVLPAEHLIDLEKLANIVGKDVSLENEGEFESLFPDCAVGAMPPFGNLYGVTTYVDKSLAEEDYIAFEAGTHTEAIKVSYRDYEKIVKPRVEDLAIKIQPMKGV